MTEAESREKEAKQDLSERTFSNIAELQEQLKQCRDCRELFGYEPRPVTWGNPDAKILHISQAPGTKVHQSGIPFSDLSGKRLRESWYKITDEEFYNPDLFYFSMMGHCYPGKGKGKGDRKPPACCYEKWAKHEIELLENCELILVVGQEAASRLFPKQKLADLVFRDHSLNGKPCYVLPHPSGLNVRWFVQHPEFEAERMPEIRKKIHQVLGKEETGKEN